VPTAPVYPISKWVNDETDLLKDVSTKKNFPESTRQTIASAHTSVVTKLRECTSNQASSVMTLTMVKSGGGIDEWGDAQANSLGYLVHALSIAAATYDTLQMEHGNGHLVFETDEGPIQFTVISGDSHELCLSHWQASSTPPRHRAVLVSRDNDNSTWVPDFGSITNTPSADLEITAPQANFAQVSYIDVLDAARSATTVAELKEKVHALVK
jgi:hypothetical protein